MMTVPQALTASGAEVFNKADPCSCLLSLLQLNSLCNLRILKLESPRALKHPLIADQLLQTCQVAFPQNKQPCLHFKQWQPTQTIPSSCEIPSIPAKPINSIPNANPAADQPGHPNTVPPIAVFHPPVPRLPLKMVENAAQHPGSAMNAPHLNLKLRGTKM